MRSRSDGAMLDMETVGSSYLKEYELWVQRSSGKRRMQQISLADLDARVQEPTNFMQVSNAEKVAVAAPANRDPRETPKRNKQLHSGARGIDSINQLKENEKKRGRQLLCSQSDAETCRGRRESRRGRQ